MAGVPLTIDQGTDWDFSFWFTDDLGTPAAEWATITAARMQFRSGVADTGAPVLAELSTENGRLSLNPAAGVVGASLSDTDTDALRFTERTPDPRVRKAYYDLELIHSDGRVQRLVEGVVLLSLQVTAAGTVQAGPQGVGLQGVWAKGDYVPFINYDAGDLVTYDGALWVSLHPQNIFNAPPSGTSGNEHWLRQAVLPTGGEGSPGPEGPQGEPGQSNLAGFPVDARGNGSAYFTAPEALVVTGLSAKNGDGAASAAFAYKKAGVAAAVPFAVLAGQEVEVIVTGLTGTQRVSATVLVETA